MKLIFTKLQARISETGLSYLLSILSRIPEILGEGIMFGSGVVNRGVKSCLQAGGGRVVTEEVGNGLIIGHRYCCNVPTL